MRQLKFEYGFKSVNGIVKKTYYLSEIPNIAEKCDVWGILPIMYIRQYTGCKDENGTYIYEGDIFKRTDTNDKYITIWHDNSFVASKVWDEWTKKDVSNRKIHTSILFMTTFKIEIIGNIHVNTKTTN
jgi:uncharacterized phage protein (TIGR01671 family)